MTAIKEVLPAGEQNAKQLRAAEQVELSPLQKKKRIAELKEELQRLEASESIAFVENFKGSKPAESAKFLQEITAGTRKRYDADAEHQKKILEHKKQEARRAWTKKCEAACDEAIRRGPSASDFLEDVTRGGDPVRIEPNTTSADFLHAIVD